MLRLLTVTDIQLTASLYGALPEEERHACRFNTGSTIYTQNGYT